MKKVGLTITYFLFALWGIAQIQIDDQIFMQFDLSRYPITIHKVIFKTYPPGKSSEDIKHAFSHHGIEAFDYYSLFPQIREYTKEEIVKKLHEGNFDCLAEIFFEIKTVNYGSYFTSNTYYNSLTNSYNTFGSTHTNSIKEFGGSIVFFDSRDWTIPLVIANGQFHGYRNKSLIVRLVRHTIMGLEQNNLIIKQPAIKKEKKYKETPHLETWWYQY